MKKTELLTIETPELESLGAEKSEQIKATFEPMTAMLAEFEDKFNELASVKDEDINKDVCAKAKRLRLDIGRVRIDTAKLHKAQKAEYLIAGRAIDGVKNILTWAVTEKENRLKEIENHFVNLENLRLDTLRLDRIESLVKNTDIDTDTLTVDLRTMETDVWDAYLASKVKEKADRIQAEKDAEELRMQAELQRIENEEKMKAENDVLRLKTIELENVAQRERERAEMEQDKREAQRVAEQEIARLEQERIKKEADKKQKAVEEKARVEREKAQEAARIEAAKAAKIQAELDARNEAERLEQERIAKEKEALKKAGDKGSMNAIRDAIGTIISRIDKTELKSKTSKQTVSVVRDLLNEAWTTL